MRINSSTPSEPPEHLIPWLIYQQSLTHKLHSAAGDARLDLLGQSWEASDAWDQSMLALNQLNVLHREILMWAFDTPCWYARTILPKATYEADALLFDRLRDEPLGHLIFNSPKIKRASLVHYPISPNSMEYAWLTPLMHQNVHLLWVRLSEFKIQSEHSFFLVEILLPGLLRYK